jgi:exosortase F-associated protein
VNKLSPGRILLIFAGIGGLALIYVFQDYLDPALYLGDFVNPTVAFIIKKSSRLILNDTCMLLIIAAWFSDPGITRTALWVQAFDTFVLLPFYLVLKLSLEGTSEISTPLLSQLHRLIVNPTLMILYIPAIYYQRLKITKE